MIEKIKPVCRHPAHGEAVVMRIDDSKEAAVERLQEIEADVKVFTDGSGEEGRIGAAAVLYRGFQPLKVMRCHLGSDKEHTVYEGECVGQSMAVELIQKEEGPVRTVLILTDNQASIRALNIFSAGPGHDIVDKVVKGIGRLNKSHEGIQVAVMWVPGHQGVAGNEAADREAKKASQGNITQNLPAFLRKPLRISKSAMKQEMQRRQKQQIHREFKKSARYLRMSRVNPHALSSKCRKKALEITHRKSSLLVQLRTGHVPLNQYLHRFHLVESPLCLACNADVESVSHFLIHCPAYAGSNFPCAEPSEPRPHL